jgi:hypothetical protein
VGVRDGHVKARRREAYLKQYVDRLGGEPARQTKLARAVAFDQLAAERLFAFDFARRRVAAAYQRLQ